MRPGPVQKPAIATNRFWVRGSADNRAKLNASTINAAEKRRRVMSAPVMIRERQLASSHERGSACGSGVLVAIVVFGGSPPDLAVSMPSNWRAWGLSVSKQFRSADIRDETLLTAESKWLSTSFEVGASRGRPILPDHTRPR
ncbi:protein of unknown function [Hyphomicrobium sp. 1Nfss2.1]